MSFTININDLTRQHALQALGFQFERGNPFIIHIHTYLHESILASGIGNTCKELSRQVFVACMAHQSNNPGPLRNAHMYHRVKVSFNIATAALGPNPGDTDAQVIFAAMMWHLASLRGLKAVRDTYEKRGVCRGCDIVVLRVKVVPEGVEDLVDWGFRTGFGAGDDAKKKDVQERWITRRGARACKDSTVEESMFDEWVLV